MNNVGLRQLRQDASDLVRRVQWRSWGEIAELFSGPDDPAWEQDRQLLDDDVRDLWAGQ